MYVDSCTVTRKGKDYTRHLLRESYREDGKVQKRTLANISDCSKEDIELIRTALKHKDDVAALASSSEAVRLRKGRSIGGVWALYRVAEKLGIKEALGDGRQGRLALWQVIAWTLGSTSRLEATRFARTHAACDVVGLEGFREDDLYENLSWLARHQERIEKDLFESAWPEESPELFLYDVTSSYLEGQCNELGAFGYNRDGKRGKQQIVVGLLCDTRGRPVSIQVFPGNTADPSTFGSQLQKATGRFGCPGITFVGDRGMIKGPQIDDLAREGYNYISAISKPQIRTLLSQGTIQMGLFDREVAEVTGEDGTRYILRRNPVRADQVRATRKEKLDSLRRKVARQNTYLSEHPGAHVDVALRKCREQAEKLKISDWTEVRADGRTLELRIDEEALKEERKLDGCYVLRTDLPSEKASKETVHARYKALTLVEQAFRMLKSTDIEVRPVNVRREDRTRGHAVVNMLSYMIVRELARRWKDLDITVGQGVDELKSFCATEVLVAGEPKYNRIPEPAGLGRKLLGRLGVDMPAALDYTGADVDTRKKLTERRKGG